MTLAKTICNSIARLAVAIVALPAMGTTYYVDSVAGNDANGGTADNGAWQSLSKINATTFSPGDLLLLKCGGSWTNTLNPKGSGANGSPIILSSYGTNPALPLINGNGNADAVVLTNQQYWEINNLEVINPGSGTATERRGIHLCAANFGAVNHLYVSNCLVHNVCGRVDTSNGDTTAKRTGGIVFEVISDASANTWFNDVIIQNCTITSVTNQGIVACGNRSGGSDYPGTSVWNSRHCSNLIIRNNVISDICKNAMSIRYADESCLVEHNLMHDTANGTDGNIICTYGCRGTVFQFNEGYHNNGNVRDGSLYDADLRSQNVIFQYSYSHDNFWGLFTHYASSDSAGDPYGNDTHVIVRYNISQNDQGDIFALTGDTGAVSSEYIYNNTIYTTNGLAPTFFDDRSSGHTYYAYNNIFYNLSSNANFNFVSNSRTFNYNVFYGQHVAGEPADAHKITNNPMLVAPGTGGGVGGTNNMSTLSGYKLQSGSPCIDSGLLVTTNVTGNTNFVTMDFFGVPIPTNGTDRGATEWFASTNINLAASNILWRQTNGYNLVSIQFSGATNATYLVQAATSLVSANWVTLATNITGTNGLGTFADPQSTNFPTRYYRVIPH